MPESNETMTPEQKHPLAGANTRHEPDHSSFFQRAIAKASASISPPHQETSVPEVNAVEKYNDYSGKIAAFVRGHFLPKTQRLQSLRNFGLRPHLPTDVFHALSRVTAPSKEHGFARSLATRAIRARLYKDLKAIPKENTQARKKVFAQAHARDEIARRYLNQSEITVDIPDLGQQMARFVTLEPPPARENSQTEKPPIFLIPGISNDLDSVAGLVQEIAYSGRRVVTVAFPETAMGSVTVEFAKAVSEASNYEPHSAFFKNALEKLIPEGSVEIWGFSTGGPIAAEILNDQTIQERTTNAVLIAPASSVNQSKKSLYLGLGHEGFGFRDTIQSFSFVTGRKEGQDTKSEQKAKSLTTNSLIDRVIKQKPDLFWGAKVRKGGKIIVISQQNDDVTKTEKSLDMFRPNPQIEISTINDAYHNTAVTEPQRIIMRVHQLQV